MRTETLLLLMIPSAVVLASCSESHAQDTAATGPNLSESMILESAAGCRFDPLTEHALDGMLLLTDWDPFTMRSAPQVFVADLELTPVVERRAEGSQQSGWERAIYTSRASFPAGTIWNGLHPVALHGFHVNNPESDHYEERGIVFAESPQALYDRLKAMGQEVPLSPGWLELTDYGRYTEGCGGGIHIVPEGDGSALICGYGC